MNPRLYLEMSPGERRAALADEDAHIVALAIDRDGAPSRVGAVIQARIARVEPGLGAAFLDLGPLGEAMLSKGRGLTEGQRLPVQVIRDAFAGKGLAASRRIALRGRALTFDAGAKGLTLAAGLGQGRRRAEAETNAKAAIARSGVGIGGFVAQEPAAVIDAGTLAREAAALAAHWAEIEALAKDAPTGALLEEAPDFVTRQLLEAPPGTQAAIDDRRVFADIQARAARAFPDLEIAFHDGRASLFDACGGTDALEEALSRRVPLAGGGRLTIDRTEALWAIDVDSGSATDGQRQAADASQKLNRRAAAEIARQIRLRNIAGLIVVDFASMPGRGRLKEIADILKGALRKAGGPAICDVLGATAAGLVEITRQRAGPALHEVMLRPDGAPLPEAEAAAALRAALGLTGAGRPTAFLSERAIAALKEPLAAAKAETDRRLGQPLTLVPRDTPGRPDVRMTRDARPEE